MDISKLTIGQAREIAALFPGVAQSAVKPAHPFVGRYCIVRCYGAGVHAGELVSFDGNSAILKNSRRLWSWTAKAGVALSGVAQHGLKTGKVDVVNPEIALADVIEVIPAAALIEESINAA
jgi:hypothetical protein